MNRMFEIIYLLLGKEQVTAAELAAHFEVSKRTIYRDIEKLTMSGIPIYTNQGNGGGIRLIEKFTLDKSVLSEQEQSEILTSLQGLRAVTEPQTSQTLHKLSSLFKREMINWIEVDFSDWSGDHKTQFDVLKNAILNKSVITFSYYNCAGQKSWRKGEPLQLWFKHGAWYLKAFCLHKNELRVFKLSRMKMIEVLLESCQQRPEEMLRALPGMPQASYQAVTFEVQIAAAMAYRVFDEFGEEQIVSQSDGSFLVHLTCPEDEWVYGYFLSFGEHLRVISPAHAIIQMKKKLMAACKNYFEVDI